MGSSSETQRNRCGSRAKALTQPTSIPETDKVPLPWTTSLFSILAEIDKVVHTWTTYSGNSDRQLLDKVHDIGTCLELHRWKMLHYLFKHRAATAWIFRYELNLSKSTVYRNIATFRALGIIEAQTTIPPFDRMKRPATVWGLPDCKTEQTKATYQLHLKLFSPIYRKAERLSKDYIDNGGQRGATRRELIDHLKDLGVPPRDRLDLANMMGTILRGGP